MITLFGKPLRGPTSLTRLVLLVALSIALLTLDHRGQHLEQIRAALKVVVYPLQVVASIPVAVYQHTREAFATERTLREQNEALAAERQTILVRLQQFEALEAENARLRDLLGSAARVADRALAAELLEVSLEPFSRRIVLARGTRDGVYVGQPVIDAHGIMGQITEVAPHIATATLITDPSHAIPVLVSRSGLRTMVFGTGDPDSVVVPYLTASADIREGDLLVSSGMGGTFPAGYPVATVSSIDNDPNEAFLTISARPAALLNHGKQVLLVWPGQGQGKSRAPTSAKATP